MFRVLCLYGLPMTGLAMIKTRKFKQGSQSDPNTVWHHKDKLISHLKEKN